MRVRVQFTNEETGGHLTWSVRPGPFIDERWGGKERVGWPRAGSGYRRRFVSLDQKLTTATV